ncbi:unnamed protein product [Rhodiola kirilowii]
MKTLCWNCRGLGHPRTVRCLTELVRFHKPQVVGLIETKMDGKRVEAVRRKIGFSYGLAVDSQGRSGGLAIWWSEDIQLSVSSFSKNHIDCEVDLGGIIRVTVFYGNPSTHRRSESWNLLRTLGLNNQLPWLVLGDFNEVLFGWEIWGGRIRKEWQMRKFREAISDCGLFDLGFSGLPFTYSNRRAGSLETRVRLDRAFGNMLWKDRFNRYEVLHLITATSDHMPLLVNFQRRINCSKERLFRFEPMWLRHKDFSNFLKDCWVRNSSSQSSLRAKLTDCSHQLMKWNNEVFGVVQKRIKAIKKEIEQVKTKFRTEKVIEEEAQLYGELDEWLAREELLWRQRSRIEWLKEGDSNTKFFHARASQRKRKNTVRKIKGADGSWITGDTDICDEASRYFLEILSSCRGRNQPSFSTDLEYINHSVSSDKAEFLASPFTAVEVQSAVFQMGATKAPGPDGFSALFFQENWDIVKREVVDHTLRFLNEGGELEEGMNDTLITLIPKTQNPSTFDEFRPISLCNVAMKIITKVLANRLKIVLQDCISPTQSAFVPGRLISDNILTAHELFNFMKTRKQGETGYCCIKLDMSKAYDRMEWDFLEVMQLKMGFPESWVRKIMQCVRTVVYRIKLNDMISDPFKPQRGIRQGDPLSPYLFVLCTEWLARSLEVSQQNREIQGIRMSRSAPYISHLFFADDCILFIKADVDHILKLKKILSVYEEVSGQQINYGKSELCVGNNVGEDRARCLGSIMGVRVVNEIGKYLGLPIWLNGKKTELLNFIEDRMWKKVNGWKGKLLSVAGKEILIKSVVQAIPIYVMSCFKIPKGVFDRWDRVVSSYWWNDAKEGRFIAWLSKRKLQIGKEEGGLGLRNFHLVNLALLIKQAWRIHTKPDLLLSRIYKARYFPNSDLFQAVIGRRPSWAWRSIFQGIQILKGWMSYPDNDQGCRSLLRSNGEFSTRRAYGILLKECCREEANIVGETSDKESMRQFWRKFWKVRVQRKAKLFMWKLFHNAIPVTINLKKRGCSIDMNCIVCGYKEESAVHLFINCWWAAEFWRLLLKSPIFLEIRFFSISDWIWFCLQKYEGEELINIFCGVRWIWWNRNKLWHQEAGVDILAAVALTKRSTKEFQNPGFRFVVSSHEAGICWVPPVQGSVKISCDGAWDPFTRAGGIGIVCRNHEGLVEFVHAEPLENLHSALEVEGVAICLGMKLAARKGLTRVTFVSDCAEIIQVLLREADAYGSIKDWRKDCGRLLEAYGDWKLEHVLREANSAADHLAHKAREETWSWSSMEAIPRSLSPHILRDRSQAGLCDAI